MRLRNVWNFLLITTIFFKKIFSEADTSNSKYDQNVGTVLFDRSESSKRCWTTEDFIILNSRRMLQDLLPKAKVLSYNDDRYIALLMDYFDICLESVKKLSIGKTRHLVLKALADIMAGYLQGYILPLTRHAYYAGNIKYHKARRLFELYDELKNFLRSNGAGWIALKQDTKDANIPPIVITPPETLSACNGLIVRFSTNKGKREFPRFLAKRRKRFSSRRESKNEHNHHNKRIRRNVGKIMIPLPHLDDDLNPNSIILPFKKNDLLSLYSEKSAFAVVKYYIASIKCIMSHSHAKEDLERFNKEFFGWLQHSVRPHLESDKWYPAFGGVLRIFATLESLGIKADSMPNSGILAKVGIVHNFEADESSSTPHKSGEDDSVTFGTVELISIALVSVLLVWLLVGLSLVCYKFLMRNSEECQPCRPQNYPVAVLYENKDYCEPKTCQLESQGKLKAMLNKIKNWWRNRFGKCPSRCEGRHTEEERYLGTINYISKDSVPRSNSTKACQKRKHSKSFSGSPLSSSKDRVSYRHTICYSTDGSLSTNSDSPVRPR